MTEDIFGGAGERVAALSDAALTAAHTSSHANTDNDPGLTVHHLLAAEMSKRGLTHGHESDDLAGMRVLVASTDMPTSLLTRIIPDASKAVDGLDTVTVDVLLSVNGYEVRVKDANPYDASTNCPDCAMGCACTDGCDCWSGCACPDCDDADDDVDPDMDFDPSPDESDAQPLARLMGALLDALSMDKSYSFAHEQNMINRNKKRRDAALPHPFQEARYMTRDGRKRCLMCGQGAPDGGTCNMAKDGPTVSDVHVDSTNWAPSRKKPTKKADSYTPPKDVQAAAQRALGWLKDGLAGDGFTAVGRKRASDLAAGHPVSPQTIQRMNSFFARHSVDSQATGWNQGEKGYPTPGRVAWDAWGGDAGKRWARSIGDSLEKHGPHKFQEAVEGPNCATCSEPRDNWRHKIRKSLVSKADVTRRYTLGPMYVPDSLDAHGEWTDADELQQAVWDYVRAGDRRIRLQHDRSITAGEWVEVMAWPYEVTVPMMDATGDMGTTTFPANTVFLGVVWEPWAWSLIQQDKLRGFSIGGKAERVLADFQTPDEQGGWNTGHYTTTELGPDNGSGD